MTDAGPNNAGTGTDIGGGTYSWTNPGNITADDNSDATAVISGNTVLTNSLVASNFGFSIPSDATVNGVQFGVRAWYSHDSGTAGAIVIRTAQLRKAGADAGTAKTNAGSTWSTSEAEIGPIGSSSDLWGTTVTPSDANNSGFGLRMQCWWSFGLGQNTAHIDLVTCTVTYTPAAGKPRTQVRTQAVHRAAHY